MTEPAVTPNQPESADPRLLGLVPAHNDHVEALVAHLARQEGVADTHVRLDNGDIVKVGSHRSGDDDGND